MVEEAVATVLTTSKILIPDYSDIKWEQYPDLYYNSKSIYITGSRGCVKNCTFCDIHTIWPKYKYRSSVSIFKEILELRERWDRRDFHFGRLGLRARATLAVSSQRHIYCI